MRLGYDMSLSIRVKELLDEGTLNQIIAQVQEDLDGEWKSTSPSDSATRELIYHEIHALNRFSMRMQSIVNDLLMQEEKANVR